ncbi:MAG TPA: protein kinase [Candidatus Eisenbacteria bacterium]|nr:protein kinase [Candidatus Eisenbacteria bacterium]
MIGQKFGHYLIEEKLGEGGMGVVYRAHDEKLQRHVALKFLGALPTGTSASHERVLEEARAISALNHPNICTIYEVGEIGEKPYIAMEFVEGHPLSMEIPSRGMPLEQVERFGMQLADALGHAHSRGIIHRDLKSANAILTPQGRLKVLDFGISRRLETGSGGEETTRFDKSWESQHTFTGTLPYVAPEVLRGEEGDARSDIWSLGVLLYEMAAGRRPFCGGTAFELSAAILRERTPLITPPLPPILQSVIDRCLEKDPGQRYQSAGEVRAALEAATTSSRTHEYFSVLAQREGRAQRKFTLRIVAIVMVLLLAAGAWAYWAVSNSRTKPRKVMVGAIQSIAVLPLENLSGDPAQDYFADGMTDALITELSQIKKLRVISRTSVMQYKHTQKSLQEIAQELNVDAAVEGSVVRSGDRVRISAKLFQANVEGALWADNFERKFTDVLALQSDVATAIARGIQVELSQPEASELARSRTVVPDAYEAYLKGRYEEAKRTPDGIQAALSYFQTATEKDPTFAEAYAGLAVSYMNLSNYELRPAAQAMPQAMQAAEKSLTLDDRLAEAHVALAAIRFYSLERGGIESEFLRGIALNPGYAQGLHWYALFLAANGRKEESITEIKLAREIDPRSLIINANVGWCYYLAGDYDKAIEAEKEALRLDPSFGVAYGYLSQAYVERGAFADAIDEGRNFISLAPGDVSRRAELAAVYGRAGRRKEAQEMIASFPKTSSGPYVSAYDWAMAYSGLREKQVVLQWLEKAYEERNGRLVNLGQHPQFAFLRKEPAFRELIAHWQVAPAGAMH